jgi:gamma-glutamylcyclotransferase (GGCT)/AIG2-like uncharacterized protein YtfP
VTHRLFVYGSLLRGESAHGRLAGARCLGAVETAPGFELVDLGDYPGLLPSGTGSGRVHGELYAVPDALVPDLDLYEDHPDLFTRTEIALADGSRAEAYVVSERLAAGRPRVASGSWKDRAKRP